MEVSLYPGDCENHLKFYTDFFTSQNICYKTESCFLGYKILIFSDENSLNIVSSHCCRFIVDFYLKEAVICKIYDEYPSFNTDDASFILSKVCDMICSSPVNDDILSILKNHNSFIPESYVIFNIKSVMMFIYAVVDDVAGELIYNKQKEKFISMLRMFSKLSFNNSKSANVEFSSETQCLVTVDENNAILMDNSDLLAFLTETAPDKLSIKNSDFCPVLANVVSEIFNTNYSDI